MEEKNNVLIQGCLELGIHLTDTQVNQFETYYELLVEWNKVMNLTGITEYDEVMQKHFVDSLSIVKAADLGQCKKVLDMGTGAGFPGIPIKIVYPHLEVVLLDSLNKRIKFLNEVIGKLGLSGITAIHGRAEDYAKQKEYREMFDLCVSRAVANLASLSEYCIPYTMLHGNFISYKSGSIEDELQNAKNAVFLLGGKMKDTVKFTLPGSDIERSLVVIEKVKKTPGKYPRKAGLPAKEPIA
ncbi:16S rRNA (guanine(527)-N(7))-methyltransferase RsmG [Robinsoniella peoriensis]|uniref:Ribosomal RNA small subunit methyltransferase G n=1 Tax=Robinsoniella peoriensis TaxID=180332 RepID=A0A4V6HRP1_9FIRM|nr:16S rRNA (guanine(527)-N(7))-methyltransferase RsmG [Robinsoniella peoriensis]MDU7029632.1 16S rRNA (guanine(527)-N(7))-methyltransferase RsmG [Clostridiales bacterium]TLC99817.1 Ribosomal RNA small subunit methyltransferase G [Robinsoniella peoriensis]